MLHSVPALLDELEARLIAGLDPLPLLASVDWRQLVGWPVDLDQARGLKRRIGEVQNLLRGLEAPVRATLATVNSSVTYRLGNAMDRVPLVSQLHQEI